MGKSNFVEEFEKKEQEELKELKRKYFWLRPAIARPEMRKMLPIHKWDRMAKAEWIKQRKKIESVVWMFMLKEEVPEYPFNCGMDSVAWTNTKVYSAWEIIFRVIKERFVGHIKRNVLWWLWELPQEKLRIGGRYWQALNAFEDWRLYNKQQEKPLNEMTREELENKRDFYLVVIDDANVQIHNEKDAVKKAHFAEREMNAKKWVEKIDVLIKKFNVKR